jgi:Zn finger protein HypA/HybF involved in hydrogenase expression
MHALAAADEAGARRVERLTFAAQPYSHITQETLQVLVEALARGTPLEGAAVELAAAAPDHPELTLVSIDVEVGTVCVA